MPVNRTLYNEKFIDNTSLPAWICGSCGIGSLMLIPGSFSEHEGSSIALHDGDYFDPDITTFVFSCFARCANSACQECAAICGHSYIDLVASNNPREYHGVFKRIYIPMYFSCAPRVIPITPDIPQPVSVALQRAFSLYWTDYLSCVNALRTVIEITLDELNINKTQYVKSNKKTGKRKRIPLSLHKRIGLLEDKYRDAEDLLLAAKWTGNFGTHGNNKLGINDVFDAFDIVEQALIICFDTSKTKARKLAKKINSIKKPIGNK